MTLRGVVAVCVCLIAGCEHAPPQSPVKIAINLPVTRFVLPNGLEVIIQEDHRTPRVAVNLRYHVGHKDDPPGRGGLAHLVEHLQFTQSEHTQPDSFFHTINELGAQHINGTTEADATSYFETVPASSLDATLWIEADRMASARQGYVPSAIAREKNVVAQELRLRFKNDPDAFRYHFMTRAVYPEGHPYRQSLDEEAEERASTADELRTFAAKYYTPDNATLMLVGDVDPKDVKEIVTRHFAAIEPCIGCRPARAIPPVEVAALKRLRIVADVDAPSVIIAWPLPAPIDDGYYDIPFAMRQLAGAASAYTDDDERGKHMMRPNSVGWGKPWGGRLGTIGAIYGVPDPRGTPEDLFDGIVIGRHRIVANEWAQLGAQRSYTIASEVRSVEALGDRATRMQQFLELYGDPATSCGTCTTCKA